MQHRDFPCNDDDRQASRHLGIVYSVKGGNCLAFHDGSKDDSWAGACWLLYSRVLTPGPGGQWGTFKPVVFLNSSLVHSKTPTALFLSVYRAASLLRIPNKPLQYDDVV